MYWGANIMLQTAPTDGGLTTTLDKSCGQYEALVRTDGPRPGRSETTCLRSGARAFCGASEHTKRARGSVGNRAPVREIAEPALAPCRSALSK